jgi:hypothetical protein
MSSLEPGSSAKASAPPPVTPDGRYIVVRGRLWRRANPDLDAEQRRALTADLMRARRAVGAALRAHDDAALAAARAHVNDAKIALGERGPVWWSDGTPGQNRRMARNTRYADWYEALERTA